AGRRVRRNLTAGCGQVCAVDGFAARTSTARKATPNARRCMLSNGTSDVMTQRRRRAPAGKPRLPRGIARHFPLMNDSTVWLKTLRAPMAAAGGERAPTSRRLRALMPSLAEAGPHGE